MQLVAAMHRESSGDSESAEERTVDHFIRELRNSDIREHHDIVQTSLSDSLVERMRSAEDRMSNMNISMKANVEGINAHREMESQTFVPSLTAPVNSFPSVVSEPQSVGTIEHKDQAYSEENNAKDSNNTNNGIGLASSYPHGEEHKLLLNPFADMPPKSLRSDQSSDVSEENPDDSDELRSNYTGDFEKL